MARARVSISRHAERSGAERQRGVATPCAARRGVRSPARSLALSFPLPVPWTSLAKGGDLLQLLIHRSLADIPARREPCHCRATRRRGSGFYRRPCPFRRPSLYLSRADPRRYSQSRRSANRGIRSDRRFTLPFVFIRTPGLPPFVLPAPLASIPLVIWSPRDRSRARYSPALPLFLLDTNATAFLRNLRDSLTRAL